MPSARLLLLDCDSTLSAIEGVDEMARMRGPKILKAVEEMTIAASDGATPIEEIFAKRLDMIRPTKAMCAQIAAMYAKRQAPGLIPMLDTVRKAGWTPVIVSGGFRQAIAPLARRLSIGRIEAVDLEFTTTGNYAGFDTTAPTARSGGKADIVRKLRHENIGSKIVMVGDAASDMECRGVADLFVGFGGFVERPRVKTGAQRYIRHFDELASILAGLE